jgi:selenium-binding protein 1
LSLLKTQDTAFYFDVCVLYPNCSRGYPTNDDPQVSNPYRPKFTHSNRGIFSSIVDEIRAKPEGYDSPSSLHLVRHH